MEEETHGEDVRKEKPGAKQVGLRDVAKAAGVSTATVSRVLNDPERVSPSRRDRVLSVIQNLNWVPDGSARALSTRRTGTIGAVFPTLTHGDFARTFHVLQNELARTGQILLLALSEYDIEVEFRQVRKFIERGVDGLILVGATHHRDLAGIIAQRGLPVVQTFLYDRDSSVPTVGHDNRDAVYRLTKYLIALGHRRVAFIAQSMRNNDRAKARLQGMREALAEHGLQLNKAHFLEGHWNITEGKQMLRQLLSTDPRPTAIVCGNPHLAVGVTLEAQELGLSVPGDISIACYDDSEIIRELPVPITSVRGSSEEVGRHAVRILLELLEGENSNLSYECRAEILVRASCAPPPADAG